MNTQLKKKKKQTLKYSASLHFLTLQGQERTEMITGTHKLMFTILETLGSHRDEC